MKALCSVSLAVKSVPLQDIGGSSVALRRAREQHVISHCSCIHKGQSDREQDNLSLHFSCARHCINSKSPYTAIDGEFQWLFSCGSLVRVVTVGPRKAMEKFYPRLTCVRHCVNCRSFCNIIGDDVLSQAASSVWVVLPRCEYCA